MDPKPLVSVVVPVLNSEKTLKKCLTSILNQSYDNIEVLVVDGGSHDRTVEIAQDSGAEVVDAGVASMTRQTNMGILNSKGKYIYRIDSDVILPSNIVMECVEKCEAEKYDGVCVFWLPDESISFWAKVRRIEKESYVKTPNCVGSIKYDKNVLGARFLRRDVFDAVGGFDEGISTIGEDYALYNKLAKSSFKFALIKSREKHVGEPRRIKDIIMKNFRYGTALMQFSDNQEDGTKQFSPAGRTYLIKAFETAGNRSLTLFLGLMIYLFAVYTSTATGIVYYKFTMKTKKLA